VSDTEIFVWKYNEEKIRTNNIVLNKITSETFHLFFHNLRKNSEFFLGFTSCLSIGLSCHYRAANRNRDVRRRDIKSWYRIVIEKTENVFLYLKWDIDFGLYIGVYGKSKFPAIAEITLNMDSPRRRKQNNFRLRRRDRNWIVRKIKVETRKRA